MQMLEQSGTVDDVSKTAGADHVVADQSEVAAFLATPATHGAGIGAGIYVLLGVTAGRAGIYAPVIFVLASIVKAFSASLLAERSAKFPVSAGEAAYVRAGFRSVSLSLVVGLLVIQSGVV
jgi:amino acid transporter